MLEKYEDFVETPHNGYERLGVRSHAKGTFHSYVEQGKELETAKMYRVAADKLIFNITFAWEHAVAITDENDVGKLVSHRFPQFSFNESLKPHFFKFLMLDKRFKEYLELCSPGGAGRNRVLNTNNMLQYKIKAPNVEEQTKIATYFDNLDNLITLHQRKLKPAISRKKYISGGATFMLDTVTKDTLFWEYYSHWIKVYKEGAVRNVTLNKYLMTQQWLVTVAWLMIGSCFFADFMLETHSFTEQETEAFKLLSWKILTDLACAQIEKSEEDVPTKIFTDTVHELFIGEKIYAENIMQPVEFPRGEKVGYFDEQFYYFLPNKIYSEVNKACAARNEFYPISSKQLLRQLSAEGISVSSKGKNTLQKRIGNANGKFLCIPRAIIDG